jgi:hypothetical protein
LEHCIRSFRIAIEQDTCLLGHDDDSRALPAKLSTAKIVASTLHFGMRR